MRFITFILSVCMLLCVSAFGADRRRFVVAVPHQFNQESAEVIWKSTTTLVTSTQMGDSVRVFDGRTQELLADIVIPDAPTTTARLRRLNAPLVKLGAAIKQRVGTGLLNNQIHLPALTKTLRETVPDARVRALVFGSLHFSDPREPGISTRPGLYPSDAWITANVQQSMWSAQGLAGKAGIAIDFIMLGDHGTELQRRAVERFTSIYLNALGMEMVTATPSADIALQRALTDVRDPVIKYQINRMDTVREIRSVPADPLPATPPVPEQVQAAVRELPQPRKGFVNLSAVWVSPDGGTADVDLYASLVRGGPELRWDHTQIPGGGRYLSDVRSSSQGMLSEALAETIEFPEAELSKIVCYLNLYEGSGTKVEGVIRVQSTDHRWDMPFVLSGKGDKGAGRDGRDGNPAWLRVALDDVDR